MNLKGSVNSRKVRVIQTGVLCVLVTAKYNSYL